MASHVDDPLLYVTDRGTDRQLARAVGDGATDAGWQTAFGVHAIEYRSGAECAVALVGPDSSGVSVPFGIPTIEIRVRTDRTPQYRIAGIREGPTRVQKWQTCNDFGVLRSAVATWLRAIEHSAFRAEARSISHLIDDLGALLADRDALLDAYVIAVRERESALIRVEMLERELEQLRATVALGESEVANDVRGEVAGSSILAGAKRVKWLLVPLLTGAVGVAGGHMTAATTANATVRAAQIEANASVRVAEINAKAEAAHDAANRAIAACEDPAVAP